MVYVNGFDFRPDGPLSLSPTAKDRKRVSDDDFTVFDDEATDARMATGADETQDADKVYLLGVSRTPAVWKNALRDSAELTEAMGAVISAEYHTLYEGKLIRFDDPTVLHPFYCGLDQKLTLSLASPVRGFLYDVVDIDNRMMFAYKNNSKDEAVVILTHAGWEVEEATRVVDAYMTGQSVIRISIGEETCIQWSRHLPYCFVDCVPQYVSLMQQIRENHALRIFLTEAELGNRHVFASPSTLDVIEGLLSNLPKECRNESRRRKGREPPTKENGWCKHCPKGRLIISLPL